MKSVTVLVGIVSIGAFVASAFAAGRMCFKDSDCGYGEVCMKEKPTSASARCVKGAKP